MNIIVVSTMKSKSGVKPLDITICDIHFIINYFYKIKSQIDE